MEYIPIEPWRTGERDLPSVLAITPRCPDNRRKFRVHGTIYVGCQNMITVVLLCNHLLPPDVSLYKLIDFRVYGTMNVVCQNIITAVLLRQPISKPVYL